MSACCDDCAKTGGTCGDSAKTTWSVGAAAMARVGADPVFATPAEQTAYNQGQADGRAQAFPVGTLAGGLGVTVLLFAILYANRGKVIV